MLASVGIEVPEELPQAGKATADDVLDAAAGAWTAHRVATGHAGTFPPSNGRGQEFTIHY
ncbi:MAG TPA: DUF429 domain-containing protein [Actinomycetota bacterium]|nr:DUF429 domain-containing protein [Actinomycetota bacterium]